ATSDELRQLFKDKQYQPLLQKLQRVLLLKGDAAKPYDRCELLMLKGETHLQLKEQSLAAASYAEAVKAIDAQTDAKEAAIAQATVLLVKRSHAYAFTPHTAPRGQAPKAISILDLDQRPACFEAMFEDAKGEIVAKVKSAKSAKTLVPIVEAVNAVAGLRTLEMAAYGKEEQSAAQLDGLALGAKDLMIRGVKDLNGRAAKIRQQANELLPVLALPGTEGTSEQLYYKKGLRLEMNKELKQILADTDRIAEAAKQFADISKASADGFGEVQAAAEKVGK